MAGLRPIGSEKLEGVDKIQRIMEIARYRENTPQSVNESKSNVYSKELADGNTYVIAKEKNGYVIKKSLTESVESADYIEPMKNRKYYSSYSQAFKRLNLIAKEVNINEGNSSEVSLFEQKKYTLKTPKPAPAPAPAPELEPAPAPDMELGGGEDLGMEDDFELPDDLGGEDEIDMDVDVDVEDGENDVDELVSFKTIQKLTGKLAQKIRSFIDKGEEMSSKDIKYVINSILSSLELDKLDEEDRDEILEKFEEADYDIEMGSEEDIDLGDEELDMDVDMDIEGGETDESWGAVGRVAAPMVASYVGKKLAEDDDEEDDFETKATKKVGDMFEEIFSESKVDRVLERYFEPSESEKQLLENKKKNIKKVKTVSESISQEVASIKFLKKHPNAKLVGKTNKNNLVFESEEKKVRISPKGIIL